MLEAGEYMLGGHAEREWLRIGVCHSHTSREERGHYAPRVHLRVWLHKRKDLVRGVWGVDTILRKVSGHRAIIMCPRGYEFGSHKY